MAEGDDKPKLYTPAEAAAILRVSEPTIRRWLNDGIIKGINIARVWRIQAQEIDLILSGQRNRPRKDKHTE